MKRESTFKSHKLRLSKSLELVESQNDLISRVALSTTLNGALVLPAGGALCRVIKAHLPATLLPCPAAWSQ